MKINGPRGILILKLNWPYLYIKASILIMIPNDYSTALRWSLF